MPGPSSKIPSERLAEASPEVAAAFKSLRAAIEKHGPLDYATREYLMLAAFAAAGSVAKPRTPSPVPSPSLTDERSTP